MGERMKESSGKTKGEGTERVKGKELLKDQTSEAATRPNRETAGAISTKREFQRGSTHREQLPRGARGRATRKEGMRGSEWGWTKKRAKLRRG